MTKTAPALERDILIAVRVVFIKCGGCKIWRHNAGVFHNAGRIIQADTVAGMADLIGIASRGLNAGKFIAVEVKRPGVKPTANQEWFLDMISQSGGLAAVCHSKEQAIKLVKEWRLN